MGSTRNLYRRSDGRYGDDDPVCWPQPFNSNYPWYSAITKKPDSSTSLADDLMWLDLQESDITYTAEGTLRKESVVKKELTDELESQIKSLKRRSLEWRKTNQDNFRCRFLKEHTDTIDVCLTRLKTVSASIRLQQLALTELQRGFLTVQAVLDYTALESSSIISDVPLLFQRNKMGAFVWNGWIWTTVLVVGANRPTPLNMRKKVSCFPCPLRSWTELVRLHLADRIQWFRAREEVERLREKLESIQAHFLNGLRGFRRMQEIWSKTADLRSAPASAPYAHITWSLGHAAFAQRQAKMYEQLFSTLKVTHDKHRFDAVPEGGILADVVARQRGVYNAKLKATIDEHLRRAQEFTARIDEEDD